jgi:capsular exopolysaccharide synthesis family protein
LPAADAEAFRLLRANLRYFNAQRTIRNVVITSAQPGDGKSTTSLNLAVVAAQSGSRTLLIEADLRKPSLGGLFSDIAAFRGLTDVLAGAASLEEAITRIPTGPSVSDEGGTTLDALFAGPLPPNPTDLIDSERMRALLRETRETYDLVIVDTPPTTVVADAIPLMTMVDGVIVIARLGGTSRDAARHLHEQLQNLDASVLGLVINFAPAGGAGYYSYADYAPVQPHTNGGESSKLEKV